MIFSAIKCNQVINNYNNEVKNRDVQFGKLTNVGKGCNGKCIDVNLTVKY